MIKYATLRKISTIYKGLAVIVCFMGFIIGIIAAYGILSGSAAVAAIAILIGTWIVIAIFALIILTASEMMNVLLDIVEDTRRDDESE